MAGPELSKRQNALSAVIREQKLTLSKGSWLARERGQEEASLQVRGTSSVHFPSSLPGLLSIQESPIAGVRLRFE